MSKRCLQDVYKMAKWCLNDVQVMSCDHKTCLVNIRHVLWSQDMSCDHKTCIVITRHVSWSQDMSCGHDLDMIWKWFGHHLDIIWTWFGHDLDIIWGWVENGGSVIFAPNLGGDNIASDFQCSWNFGAKNIAAQFLRTLISVLWISPGGFLIAS